MRELLWVGAGSFLGGIARFSLSAAINRLLASPAFPFGTLAVNILGCLLIGFLAGLIEGYQLFSEHMRLFLITGVLGGFTTFSAFGYETVFLARNVNLQLAILNVVSSLGICLLAVWIGLRLAKLT